MTREDFANTTDSELMEWARDAVAFLEQGRLCGWFRGVGNGCAPYDIAVRALVEVARRWTTDQVDIAGERWTLVDDRVAG